MKHTIFSRSLNSLTPNSLEIFSATLFYCAFQLDGSNASNIMSDNVRILFLVCLCVRIPNQCWNRIGGIKGVNVRTLQFISENSWFLMVSCQSSAANAKPGYDLSIITAAQTRCLISVKAAFFSLFHMSNVHKSFGKMLPNYQQFFHSIWWPALKGRETEIIVKFIFSRIRTLPTNSDSRKASHDIYSKESNRRFFLSYENTLTAATTAVIHNWWALVMFSQ